MGRETSVAILPSRTPREKLARLRELALAGSGGALPVKLWLEDQAVLWWAYETLAGADPRVGRIPTLAELERAHAERILELAPTVHEAARILGVDPATLWRKRQAWKRQDAARAGKETACEPSS